MARKNPVPENEKRICARLLFFRRDIKKLTRQAMAESLGIAAKRLEVYEQGRVPLTTDTALRLCSIFDVNQHWLATGKGQVEGCKELPEEIRSGEVKYQLFSDTYEKILKHRIPVEKSTFERLMESGSPRFAEGGLTIQTIFGTYGAGTVSADNIASALAKELKIKLEMLPPDERTRFKNQILRAAVEFGSMDQKEKSNLTNVNEVVNLGSLKPQLPSLLDRLNAATLERGRKSELAKFLGVSLVQVSQWLNRDREPGGETTLRLLKWVEQEERQK